jgi:hypothetical protein
VNELIWLIAEHRAEHNGRRMGRVGKRRTDCNTEKSGKTNLQRKISRAGFVNEHRTDLRAV